MTSVSANNYSNLTATSGASATTAPKKTALGQADFLKLMTTQMTHQDPSQPMSNGEFITQMAQFGTVSGIQDLQKSFGNFASSINDSQALQATSLVGKYVSVPGTQGLLPVGGNIKGNIVLPDSVSNVHVEVTDSAGQVVQNVDLGMHSAGTMPFTWDGTDSNGTMVSPGVYNIVATANIGGANTGLETDINSEVDSITMASGANGLKVNLSGGLGSIDFNKIKQIL
ncbi:MAG: flagellar hook assembly protein FlgD [Methylobacter sp.]